MVRESGGCDSEAAPKQRLEKEDRGMLWDLILEKDGIYVGHIQVHIYKAALEEGASMTQAVISKGPLPEAQDLAQACCLQEGSLVRQRYIVAEGQKEVVSQPPTAVREGPLVRPTARRADILVKI